MYEIKTDALFAECTIPQDAPLTTVVEAVVDSSRYFALRIEDPVSRRHAFIGVGFRERTEASDFNAALHEHTQYLRRKKEALQMRETYNSTADEPGSSDSDSQSELSLKPGETITLKLAKSQLSPPATAHPALQRLGSKTITLPHFQTTAGPSGQIPCLAPPPSNRPDQMPSQLSGVPGMSSEPAEHSEESGKASPSTADKTSVSASATGHRDTQTDGAEEEHTPSQPGKTDQQPAVSASDQPQATDSIQPGVDDWGDFVS